MKKILFLLLIIPIFLFSCNKQEDTSIPIESELVNEIVELEEILPPDIVLNETEESERIDSILNSFLELVQNNDMEALKDLFIPEQAEEYKTGKDYTFRHMFSNRQAYYGIVQNIEETTRTINQQYVTSDRRGSYAEVSFRIENEKAVSLELIKLYRPITEEEFYVLGYHYSLEE